MKMMMKNMKREKKAKARKKIRVEIMVKIMIDITSASLLQLSTGQWVMVDYEGECFPGEVTQCDSDDIDVNVMHNSGKYWKCGLPLLTRYFTGWKMSTKSLHLPK